MSPDGQPFILAGITAGRAIIEVTKTGFQTWSDEIVIDHDAQLNVNLTPIPATNTAGGRGD